MRDTIRRIIATVLWLGWIAVMGYYTYNNITIVKDYMMNYNYYILWATSVLLLLFVLWYGIGLMPIKWLKIRSVSVGLLLILAGYYLFVNNPSAYIFVGDVLSVIWVLIVFLTLWWLIITTKATKKIETSKQIVIEV